MAVFTFDLCDFFTYNGTLMDKVTDSSNSVVQERYITLPVHRKNMEEAHNEELGAEQRLQVLHDFYCTGKETEFYVDLRGLTRKSHNFKDTIYPYILEFKRDYSVMDGKYGRVLFMIGGVLRYIMAYIRELPQQRSGNVKG